MNFLIIFPDWGYFPLPYRRTIPPLSPAILAGILKNYGTVKYIDERHEGVPFDEEFDCVFVTAMTNQIDRAYKICRKFKARDSCVVLGGIHPSLLPAEAEEFADAVFIGEAEETIPRFIRDLKSGTIQKRYICRNWAEVDVTRFQADRSIYPGKGYLPLDPIQFFRGCRLNCEACSIPQTQGKTVVFRPTDLILSEMEEATDFLFLINDDLYFHKQKIYEIFKGMEGMGKQWLGLGAAEMAKETEFLEAMERSGCWLLYLDFGPREAIALNHPERLKGVIGQMANRIRKFHDYGIKLIGSFTFGYDFDTPDIFDNTLAFCRDNKLEEAEFHLLVPYPNTRLALKLERDCRINCRDWGKYGATRVVFAPKNMESQQLYSGYLRAWKQFYDLDKVADDFCVESFRVFPDDKPNRITY